MPVAEETAAVWREQFPGRRIDAFGVDIRVAQSANIEAQNLKDKARR